jgi:hypothetical protein
MPRITGPLHSDHAAGHVGRAIIFQSRNGRQYAKQYATPTGPITTAQRFHRSLIKTLTTVYATAPWDPPPKWVAQAERLHTTAIAEFTTANCKAWYSGMPFIDDDPTQLNILLNVLSAPTVTKTPNGIQIDVPCGMGFPGPPLVSLWRSTTPITANNRRLAITMFSSHSRETFTYIDNPPPGTYYYAVVTHKWHIKTWTHVNAAAVTYP